MPTILIDFQVWRTSLIPGSIWARRNWEFLEMRPKDKVAMEKELQSAFQPFWSEGGFTDEFETVYITGVKGKNTESSKM